MTSSHVYEVRPRKDHRGVDLISDALPFGRLWYGEPDAISNAVNYARFYSRSHDAMIRVYDEAGNVIETHEQAGDFKEWGKLLASALAKNQSYGNMCHETETQFRQQGSSHSCFSVRNFHQHCCARESPAWSPDCAKSAELRMESGFPSPDRWQVCREHRTGSTL